MISEVLLDSDSILDAAANSLVAGKGILLGRAIAGAAVVTRVLPDPRKKGFVEGVQASGNEVLGRFLPAARPPRDTRGWHTGEVALLGRRCPARGRTDIREAKGAVEGAVGANGFRLEAWILVWIGPGPQRVWRKVPLLYPREQWNPPPAASPVPAPQQPPPSAKAGPRKIERTRKR